MHWLGFILIQAIVVMSIMIGGALMSFINPPL